MTYYRPYSLGCHLGLNQWDEICLIDNRTDEERQADQADALFEMVRQWLMIGTAVRQGLRRSLQRRSWYNVREEIAAAVPVGNCRENCCATSDRRCTLIKSENRNTDRLLYDRKTAAHKLSISVRSLDYLIAAKQIDTRRIGKKVLIPHGALVRFAQGNHYESPKRLAEVA